MKLTKETVEMVRQGLLNSEWCGFSKRATVNALCDLALKGTEYVGVPVVAELRIVHSLLSQAWEKERGGAMTPLSGALTRVGQLIARLDVPPQDSSRSS